MAALAGAATAGVIPALTSTVMSIGVLVVGLLALSVVALRRTVPRGVGAETDGLGTGRLGADAGGALSQLVGPRTARWLFYGGSLLVAEPTFRFVAGLTPAEVMFIAGVAACMVTVLRGWPIPSVPTPVMLMVGVFVFGGTISSLDAQSPPSSFAHVLHAVYVLLLWPALAAMVLRTPRQAMIALTLWTISAAVEGVAAAAQAAGLHVLGLMDTGSRMTGFTPTANDLGAATAIAFVPALMLATRRSERGPVRGARSLVVVLIGLGLMLSESVTALVAACAALLIWIGWPTTRTVSRLTVIAAIVSVLVAAAVVSEAGISSPVQRLAQVANPESQNGGSLTDRLSLVRQAWPRISRDPFVGAGLDTADSALPIISHTYNTSYQIHGLPLAAWYQAGLFGLIGLVGLLISLVRIGWRSIRTAIDEDELAIGLALMAAFLAFVVTTMSFPMVFQQYGWITAALVIAWSQRSRHQS